MSDAQKSIMEVLVAQGPCTMSDIVDGLGAEHTKNLGRDLWVLVKARYAAESVTMPMTFRATWQGIEAMKR